MAKKNVPYRSIGRSISKIADYIGKNKSVVSREISRKANQRSGLYKAELAEKKASQRPQLKVKFEKFDVGVEINVLYYLDLNFSPEQMFGRSKIEGQKWCHRNGCINMFGKIKGKMVFAINCYESRVKKS